MRTGLSASTGSRCALPLLCWVQGCERFAFFAVLPWFVLYLHRHVGLSEHAALVLLGVFLGLSYLTAFVGGVAADRWLGSGLAMLLGCVLLALGYGALALDSRGLLWLALGLQVAGHGLFKPGLNVAASELYAPSDVRRERGFMILHVAINIGAMLGPVCVEGSRWHGKSGMFTWAAGSMAVALIALLFGHACFAWNSRRPTPVFTAPVPALTATARIRAIWILCAVGVVFWLTAQQAGTSLALFADSHTQSTVSLLRHRLSLGPGRFASLHCLLVLVLMPLLLVIFTWLGRRGLAPSAFGKMAWGYVLSAGAFAVMSRAGRGGGDLGRVHPAWLAGSYVFLSASELLLSPMSLTIVTRLAPPQKTARMVGLWLAATAAGNALAGLLGLLWGRWPHHRYFGLLAFLSLGAAGVLLCFMLQLDALLRRPPHEENPVGPPGQNR